MNVLVIEDDPRIAELIEIALTEDDHRVTVAIDGHAGIDQLLSGQFHVGVLDIFLPDVDGFHVLEQVRARACTTPILVLTAVDAVPKIVRAFDLGADDYLVKPFILEILLARVSAIARRGGTLPSKQVTVRGVVLDRSRRIAIRSGREVALTKKQFELLEVFVRNQGTIVTRDQLIEAGWGTNAEVRENTLEVYIHGLRLKLEDRAAEEQVSIRTVHGTGYMLVSE